MDRCVLVPVTSVVEEQHKKKQKNTKAFTRVSLSSGTCFCVQSYMIHNMSVRYYHHHNSLPCTLCSQGYCMYHYKTTHTALEGFPLTPLRRPHSKLRLSLSNKKPHTHTHSHTQNNNDNTTHNPHTHTLARANRRPQRAPRPPPLHGQHSTSSYLILPCSSTLNLPIDSYSQARNGIPPPPLLRLRSSWWGELHVVSVSKAVTREGRGGGGTSHNVLYLTYTTMIKRILCIV